MRLQTKSSELRHFDKNSIIQVCKHSFNRSNWIWGWDTMFYWWKHNMKNFIMFDNVVNRVIRIVGHPLERWKTYHKKKYGLFCVIQFFLNIFDLFFFVSFIFRYRTYRICLDYFNVYSDQWEALLKINEIIIFCVRNVLKFLNFILNAYFWNEINFHKSNSNYNFYKYI